MPRKDSVLSRAAEMAREASETHALVKKNAEEGQCEQRSRDGNGSLRNHALLKKIAEEGQGDEQSSKDGKGGV
jgi:hypothetical protein